MRVGQSPLNWNFNSERHSRQLTDVWADTSLSKNIAWSMLSEERVSNPADWSQEQPRDQPSSEPSWLTNGKAPRVIRIADETHSPSVQTDHDHPQGHPHAFNPLPIHTSPGPTEAPRGPVQDNA